MKLKVYGLSSRRPLSAVVEASIRTSYFVASGSLRAGVKIRIVVPDQRNVPCDRRRDVEEGWSKLRRHPAERHHRLREHHANLVGFFERRNFTRRTCADDPQGRARGRNRLGTEICSNEEHKRGGTDCATGHWGPSTETWKVRHRVAADS